MGPPTAHTADQRSLHVHANAGAKTPCSATLEATRPDSFLHSPRSTPKKERPKLRPAPDDFSDFTNRSSMIIRSSHHVVNTSGHPSAADSWSPVLYDPTSDSVRIIPPSRRTPLVSQFREFKDKINGAKQGVHAHRLADLLSADKPKILSLPLRAHESRQESIMPRSEIRRLVEPYTKPSRTNWTDFDLMAPPPGRKKSCRTTQDDSASKPQLEDSEDANPSRALTSKIASSVIQERYHVKDSEATPPAVVRKDRDQRKAPSHRGSKSQSTTALGPRSGSTRSAQKTRSVPPIRRPSEDDDDPFPYDKPERLDITLRASPSDHLRIAKGIAYELVVPNYPCPFRKRNPVIFNVRDHEQCAQRAFSDMTELKRHIRSCHRRGRAMYHCPRCKQPFENGNALDGHLTVPVGEICELQPSSVEYPVEDGITEATDRVLADVTAKIMSWQELWWLLFPQDTIVLDSDFSPVIEAVEAEQEFDDSSAELKVDLCDALKRILPDQAGIGPFLAGQINLVFEQHRAKIVRRCRNKAINGDKRGPLDRAVKSKSTRFSVATTVCGSQSGGIASRRPSLHPAGSRKSQIQPASTIQRPDTSPASSVYSQGSNSNHSISAATCTSFSFAGGGALHVESPRLPFRDWVHGVKLNNNSAGAAVGQGVEASASTPRQRDSGLALQCENCRFDECQCGSYADQLSAFMTPAPGFVAAGSLSGTHEAISRAVEEGSDDDDDDWAHTYGDQPLSAGRSGTRPEMLHMRSPGVFI